LKRGKQADTDVGIFTPEQMERLMQAAPHDLIAVLAIGGFAGLRGAEIARLSWSAVDLGRKIIELRAGQAKTASRRIVPIADNLATWLAKIDRNGPVVPDAGVFLKARKLAKSLGLACLTTRCGTPTSATASRWFRALRRWHWRRAILRRLSSSITGNW
jgi:integrase